MWRNLFQNFGKKISPKKKKKKKNMQQNISFEFSHFVPKKKKKKR
jgi:hypothetical protein